VPSILALPAVTVTDWILPSAALTTIGFTGDTSVSPFAGVTLSRTGAAATFSTSAAGSTQPVASSALSDEEHPAAAAAAAMPTAPMITLRR